MLKNGGTELFRFANVPGVDYAVFVGKTRPHGHKMRMTDPPDAENYYHALAANIPDANKIHFEADMARIDQDARCLVGWVSQTPFPE
jgi:hypothetical protein